MKYEEITIFLNKLIEKTNEKKIIWDEDPFQKGIYESEFNKGFVIINNYISKSNGSDEYSIKITNDKGRTVFSYSDNTIDVETTVLDIAEEKMFNALSELYKCVHKQYYNLEETIEGMLKELDDEDIDLDI